MAFSFSRWLGLSLPGCPICGGRGTAGGSALLPVRHDRAGAALQALCGACRGNIPWIRRPVCRTCGRYDDCPDCPRRKERDLSFNRSAVRYDERMKQLLALYKYRGSERLETVMAGMLAFAYERICAELPGSGKRPPFHAVTSVPLAAERLEERGFNQAERLARLLAADYGLVYRSMLSRIRHTAKQSLKSRQSRLADMKGNFSSAADFVWEPELADSDSRRPIRILLVDDVYTTGSTLNECAKTIRAAMAGRFGAVSAAVEVIGLTWARS